MRGGNVHMVLVPVRRLMLSVRVVYVTMKLRGAADVSLCIDGLPACRLLPPAAATTTTTAFTATFLLLTLQLTTISEPPAP